MSNIIYKKNIYWLELWRLIPIAMLIAFILIYIEKIDLFFFILIPTVLLILFLSVRQFLLYQDKIVLKFLYREQIIPLSDIKKTIYHYTGGGGGSPVIIFITKDNNSFADKIYNFLMYRFILRNTEQLIFLLRFFKTNGIEIQIESTETFTKKLNEAIK